MALFTININHTFDKDCITNKLMELLLENNKNIKIIMANIAELTEKVDALQVALDNEQVQILGAIADLEQSIADLQVIVADGGTAEQRQALADKLDAIKSDLVATIPDETTGTTTTELV